MENWMSIDFGTSSSAVAIIRNRHPELAPPLDNDAAGSRIFPTVVYVDSEGKIAACHDAERMKEFDCSRFLREFKLEIQHGHIPDLGVTFTQIITSVLEILKQAAENAKEEAIHNLILTIPATYHENDIRKDIMLSAAREAKFEQIDLLKEAQAAAIYYDYIEEKTSGYSLVYDLGGGTFDAAIIKHTDKDYQLINNSMGLAIGGNFFTEKITNSYLQYSEISIDDNDPALIDSILTKCEKIKRHLSNNDIGTFPISAGKNFSLSRTEFESMISADLDKTLQACNALIEEAHLRWSDINRVLLIGGSCNVPLVQSKIKNYLISRDATKTHIVWKRTESDKEINPQFAVSLGAAVFAIKKYMVPPPTPVFPGVLKNLKTGELYRLKEGVNIFGRGNVDFSIPEDSKMSRSHFSIKVIKKENHFEYCINDLSSTYGTIVGNMALTDKYDFSVKSTVLRIGEKIVAGKTSFEFII